MNIYKAIQILEKACTSEFFNLTIKEKEIIIKKFINIPDENKPISFRNISNKELLIFFTNLYKLLKSKIEENYNEKVIAILIGNKDNKIDADLIIKCKNKTFNCELKFGNETNSNIGNKNMDKIFQFKSFTNLFINHLNIKIWKDQRQTAYILERKERTYEEISNKLLLKLSEYLENIIEIMKTNKCNINSKLINNILMTSGSNENNTSQLIKFRIDYNKVPEKIIKVISIHNFNDVWNLKDIKKASKSERIEITLENNCYDIIFLLNWKNNYKNKNFKFKYNAKLGLKTSSWNVWLKSKIKN